jgi:hypothetical protein
VHLSGVRICLYAQNLQFELSKDYVYLFMIPNRRVNWVGYWYL